jgi:hypothetical protein
MTKTLYGLLIVVTFVGLSTISQQPSSKIFFDSVKNSKVPFKMGIECTYKDMLYIRCLTSMNWNVSTHLAKT